MKRIKEIDGLRGIAILLVLTFHYINNQLSSNLTLIGKLFYKTTYYGWVGVDLFFVLSGFLIGSIILNNKQSDHFLPSFYLKRILRIIPNYYLLLLIFCLVKYSGFFDSNLFVVGNPGNAVVPIWSYFLMVHNFYMANYGNLGVDSIDPTWSIGVEEQFYIIFPFLFLKLRGRQIPFLLIFIIIFAIISRNYYEHWIPRYVLLNCRADGLAIGMLMAWIKINYNINEIAFKHSKKIYFILTLVFSICLFFYIRYNDLGVFKHTLFSLIFCILLFFALLDKDSLYKIVLRNPLLISIGKMSYSIYLFHYLILGLTHYAFGNKWIVIWGLREVWITLLALCITLFFSFLVFKYLENPLVKFGKKFQY